MAMNRSPVPFGGRRGEEVIRQETVQSTSMAAQQQWQQPPQQQWQPPPPQQQWQQHPPQQQWAQQPPPQQYMVQSPTSPQGPPQPVTYHYSYPQGSWPPPQQQQMPQQPQYYQVDEEGKPVSWPPPEEAADQLRHSTQQQKAPPPSTIQLRKEPPVSQPGVAVHPSVPPLKLFKMKSARSSADSSDRYRGDEKWPPVQYRKDPASEEIKETVRPTKQHKDYMPFFEANKLPDTYPRYKIPPGTQYYGFEDSEGNPLSYPDHPPTTQAGYGEVDF